MSDRATIEMDYRTGLVVTFTVGEQVQQWTVLSHFEGKMHTRAAGVRFAAFAGGMLADGLSRRTVAAYRSDWVGMMRWAAGVLGRPFDAADLSGDLIRRWRDALATEAQQPSTINRKLVFVKRFADWDARVPVGEREQIRRVEEVPQPPRRPRGLGDSDLGRFLTIVTRDGSARDQAIVHTLIETGIKVGELVRLRRDDVVLRDCTGYICVRANDEYRARSVQLGITAAHALRFWLGTRTDTLDSLFVGERGPLLENAIQRIIRKYCRRAAVSVTTNALRHTFADSFLRDGLGDLGDLADRMGHACMETTRLYAHSSQVGSIGPTDEPVGL